MKLHHISGLVLLLFFMNISTAIASPEKWIELGSIRASLSAEQALFNLDGTHDFSKIRFQVLGGDITLVKTKVYLNDKQAVMEGLQKLIKDGNYSRAIPLATAKQQAIRKVEIFFKVNRQTSPSSEANIILSGVAVP